MHSVTAPQLRHASSPSPDPPAEQDLASIRSALIDTGYTEQGLLGVLGNKAFLARVAEHRAEVRWLTRADRPLNTLMRLFLLGEPIDRRQAERAVAPSILGDWEGAGLLRLAEDLAIPCVRLSPCKGLVLAHDPLPSAAVAPDPLYVMGVGASSITLANITVRQPGATVLDVGCGCGTLGLLAAGYGATVCATDINPRALAYTRLNAGLNGLPLECLLGAYFEPVEGRRFDLIVSNPPFVISPESSYVYRDSGLPVDEVCRSIVRQAPAHLNEGGYCQFLCNWAHVRGEDWRERLSAWFEDTGCDAWVMRCETEDPIVYASTWLRHSERAEGAVDAGELDAWMAYYERHDIEAISAGVISMRRTARPAHWFRADDAPGAMAGPAGEDVVRGFALYDFLTGQGGPDDALLDVPLRPSPDLRLCTELAPSDDGWATSASSLRLSRGLAYTRGLDASAAGLLVHFRGSATGRQLLQAAGMAEPDFHQALDALRQFVALGYLHPV